MRDVLFRCLLPMSVAGSALYLLVLVLRPLFARLGARLQKRALLLGALLFLLPLPLLFGAGGPLAAVSGGAETAQQDTGLPAALRAVPAAGPAYEAGKALNAVLAEVSPAEKSPQQNAAGETDRLQDAANAGVSRQMVLTAAAWVYIFGVGAFACLFAARYALFRRRLANACTPVQDAAAHRRYAAIRGEYGLRAAPRLLQSATVGTPLLVGLLRPAIVLPQGSLTQKQLEFALRHELMHYKNRDILQKFVLLAVCALHWANPLCWLLKRSWGEACEHLCDEQVAKRLDETHRKAYVATLFRFAEGKAPFAAAGFASPAGMLKKRLAKLLHPVRPARWLRAGGTAALCLAVCACLLAGCGLAVGAASPGESDLSGSLPGDASSLSAGPVSSLPVSGVPVASSSVSASSTSEYVSGVVEEYLWPVPGYSYCSRGMAQGHRGLDINAAVGTPIYAANDGVVTTAGWHYSYGYYVTIEHEDGITTLYAHCSSLYVTEGQTVAQGEAIAAVGSTGNVTGQLCHFEMHDAQRSLLDPLEYVTPPHGLGEAEEDDSAG